MTILTWGSDQNQSENPENIQQRRENVIFQFIFKSLDF